MFVTPKVSLLKVFMYSTMVLYVNCSIVTLEQLHFAVNTAKLPCQNGIGQFHIFFVKILS